MAIEFTLDDGSIIEFNSIIDNKIVYNKDPNVYTVDNFVSKEECEHIIREAKPRLARAMVGAGIDPNNMDGTYSKSRTGSNCWFPHNHDPIFRRIGERISKKVGHPFINAEQFQVVHYNVGEEFTDHYDSWEQDGTTEHFHNFKFGGNRLLTVLIYLNNVIKGGGTKMTKLNHLIEAKQGKILVFEDCYKGTNNLHPLSQHCGMPVIEGEKYAVNLWFKECPYEIMYKDFRPGYFNKWNIDDCSDEEFPPMEDEISAISLHEKKKIYIKKTITNKLDTYKLCNFHSFKGKDVGWININSNTEVLDYTINLEEYLNINRSFFENIYVVKYSNNHDDFYDAYKENKVGIKAMKNLGQRMITAVLCVEGPAIYTFKKLDKQFVLNKGDCLIYKNVVNESNIRDAEMIHDIQINNGILANIYIREKNESGEILDMTSFNNKINIQNMESNSDKNLSSVSEEHNYNKIYEEVVELLKSNTLTEEWEGHKSFTHILRSNWLSIYEAAQKYIILREKDNAITTLNIKSYENVVVQLVETFKDNSEPCVWQCSNVLRLDIFKFLIEYYSNIKLQKRKEQQEYYFAHNELISRMIQFDLLPLIESIVKDKLIPLSSEVVKYEKGYEKPPSTNKVKYIVSWLLKGVSPLMIHKEPILNETYSGEYYMVKEDYKTIHYKENEFIVYRADKYITKRNSITDLYYGIEFYYG